MSRFKPVELWFKRTFFGLTNPLFRRRRRSLTAFDPLAVRRVLFIRPERIGDMVVSLPAFQGLRNRFPHVHLALLASPRSMSLVEHDPRLDAVYVYRKNLSDIGTLRRIRAQKYNVVIDMIHGDSVTALVYSQLAAPGAFRFGVGKAEHADFYDFNGMPEDVNTEHIVDVTLRLLAPFGIAPDEVNGFVAPYLRNGATERARQFVSSFRKDEARPLLGVNLSAGRPNRVWPTEKFSTLVRRLLDSDLKPYIIVTMDPNERGRGEEVVQGLAASVALVPPGLDLIDVSAIVSKLDLLITPDTSLVHIARSFGVSVVGLYNGAMRNLYLWQPYRQPEGVVVSPHPDLITDITVDQVFDRVRKQLASERQRI